MPPVVNRRQSYEPGKVMLLASSVGTAFASVCVLGLVMIHNAVPGLWALATVAIAFAICRYLADLFAHLVKTVPSGAGMFAYVSRAWGPAAGMAVIAPYLMLMILLGALEALIVGRLIRNIVSPWLPLSSIWIACVFLFASWLVCVGGLRVGFRIQALATGLLVGGLVIAAVWILWASDMARATPIFNAALFTAAPSPASFVSAIGQAVFLFMGFELVCAHVESTSIAKISWSLKYAVLVLALVYALILLAFGGVDPASALGQQIAAWAAQLDFTRPELMPQLPTSQMPATTLATLGLCLLASITSINGAFMGLSRLIAVMAAQRVLPSSLAKIHATSLIPRRALALLLLASLTCTFAIHFFSLHQAVLLAAAISATTLYAVAVMVSAKPPFRAPDFVASRKAMVALKLMLVLLIALAIGVVLDAGENTSKLIALLGLTYGAGLFSALRLGTIKRTAPKNNSTTPIKRGI